MDCFKSGKQRRIEIKTARRDRRLAERRVATQAIIPSGRAVSVDYRKLMANNSYGLSDFARRGYYLDVAFTCCDCGADCVWTAERQRWWYETVGGSQYATAKRCRTCRDQKRQRKEIARQQSRAGVVKKQETWADQASRA